MVILDFRKDSAEDKSSRKHEWQPNREPSRAGVHGQAGEQFAEQEPEENA
jgi:hypothetical protein